LDASTTVSLETSAMLSMKDALNSVTPWVSEPAAIRAVTGKDWSLNTSMG
jgi:hypothetical protein